MLDKEYEEYKKLVLLLSEAVHSLSKRVNKLEKDVETLKHIVIPIASEEVHNGYIPYDCDDCEYVSWCRSEFGNEYQAVIGTHFCRRSWDQYMNG
jgi:hypothetical protein